MYAENPFKMSIMLKARTMIMIMLKFDERQINELRNMTFLWKQRHFAEIIEDSNN